MSTHLRFHSRLQGENKPVGEVEVVESTAALLTCTFELVSQFVRAHVAILQAVTKPGKLVDLQKLNGFVDLTSEVSILEIQEKHFVSVSEKVFPTGKL